MTLPRVTTNTAKPLDPSPQWERPGIQEIESAFRLIELTGELTAVKLLLQLSSILPPLVPQSFSAKAIANFSLTGTVLAVSAYALCKIAPEILAIPLHFLRP